MRYSRRHLLAAGLLFSLANAQLSNVPELSTATQATATQTLATSQQTTAKQTTSSKDNASQATSLTGLTSTTNNDGGLATATNRLSGPVIHLTGLPTIAGAGIPTLVIPYTANAPFMRKSHLPQGTFFIAVGAVLAFFGACILLWRAMIAWSVNRSVKRTARLASMHSDKGGRSTSSYWGGSSAAGYNRVASSGGVKGGGYYKDTAVDSTISLDNLTNTGKPTKPHFRDSVVERSRSPANLFFSPTAQAAGQQPPPQHRNSGYMPSGYYASPSAQAGGGNTNIAIGGNLAPGSYGNTNRYSATSTSPPTSPGLPPASRSSYIQGGSRDSYRASSRDGLRAPSRDGLGASRDGPSRGGGESTSAYLYAQPSSSSLMVGHQSSVSDLAGSRAPSAYLEELFDNHGRM